MWAGRDSAGGGGEDRKPLRWKSNSRSVETTKQSKADEGKLYDTNPDMSF